MRRAALWSALLLVAACGSAARPAAVTSPPGPGLRLGALYPVSGAQGPGGLDEYRGVQLAADRANRDGGVRGRRIDLDVVDTASADAAPAAVETLHGRGESIVLGTYGSTISAPAADAANARGMLLWETGAVGEVDDGAGGGRSFFRMAPMGATLGRAAAAFVRETLGPRLGVGHPLRFGVAYVDDSYGRSVAGGALEDLEAHAADVVGRYRYPSRGADFDGLAAGVAADRVDVLVVVAYLEDGVALRRATVARHVPLTASIGTSSSYCMPAFGQQLGADAVGLFASDKPDAGDVPDGVLAPDGAGTLRWARQEYQARYHEEMSAPALSGFANAWALFHYVLPAAGSDDVPAVADAALAVRLPLGTLPNGSGVALAGPGEPDAGANRAAASVIWEWVGVGQRAVVWPPGFATHPVVVLPLAR